MYAQTEKSKDNNSRAISNSVGSRKKDVAQNVALSDNRFQHKQQTIETSNSTPLQARFLGDETTAPDQISKAAFLEELRNRLHKIADEELAAIQQSSANCPYLVKWFAYYQDKDAQYIERAIGKYAPETNGAIDVKEYIALLGAHVRKGLKEHVATGSTEAVPKELIEEQHAPEDFVHIASRQTAQLASCCNSAGQAQPVVAAPLPPPANAAIFPGGAHYAVAIPNYGAAGGTFRGFNIFTINHQAAGQFSVSTFDIGGDVGFHDIENNTGLPGATDLITWHLCRHSASANFEVTTVVNLNLIAHLENNFGMQPGNPGAYIGNRIAVLGLVTARLNNWQLPP